MSKYKVAIGIFSSFILIFLTTPISQAGRPVSPSVTDLGLQLIENSDIGRSPSTVHAIVNWQDAKSWRICKNLDDPICTATADIGALSNLAVCQANSQLDCILSIWAVDSNGNKSIGSVTQVVPENSKYKLNEDLNSNLPRSDGMGAIWTIPGVRNSAGTDTYFVAMQEWLNMQKEAGKPISTSKFSLSRFLAAILPVEKVVGGYKVGEAVDGSNGIDAFGATSNQFTPDNTMCAVTDINLCYAIRKFPTNYRFGMTIRLSSKGNNWFHGRFSLPNVTITDWKNGSEVSIEAEPVKVPSLDFTVPNNQIPEAAKPLVFNNQEIGMTGNGIDSTKLVSELGSQEAMNWVTAFAPAYKDKATKTNSYWAFRPLSEDVGNVGTCFAKVSGVAGLVTTNSLTYSAGPPQFDEKTKTLNYKVASPHFESDGTVAEGTYDLAIRSEVARCIYKFTNAPIKAEISVLATDGTQKVATTVVNEKDGWLYLSAKGFTFSSPTIQVALSQDAPVVVASPSPTPTPLVTASATPTPTPSKIPATTAKPMVKLKTITCVKGKLIKKVTAANPKCPTGYKTK